MSVHVMSLVWKMDISPFEKLVLLALADCSNDEGLCWPSIATLKRKTNAGERTVQRSLRALEASGHLTRKEVVGKGCQYTINPRHSGTPATAAPAPHRREPPPQRHPTPATVAPKPSKNHQEPSTPVGVERASRKTTIPANWKPEPFGLGTRCRATVDGWPPGELERQVEKFAANHSGKGNRWADWQAAWKTWVLNSEEFRNGRTAIAGQHLVAPSGRPMGRTEAAARAVTARMAGTCYPAGDTGDPRALPDNRRAIGHVA